MAKAKANKHRVCTIYRYMHQHALFTPQFNRGLQNTNSSLCPKYEFFFSNAEGTEYRYKAIDKMLVKEF